MWNSVLTLAFHSLAYAFVDFLLRVLSHCLVGTDSILFTCESHQSLKHWFTYRSYPISTFWIKNKLNKIKRNYYRELFFCITLFHNVNWENHLFSSWFCCTGLSWVVLAGTCVCSQLAGLLGGPGGPRSWDNSSLSTLSFILHQERLSLSSAVAGSQAGQNCLRKSRPRTGVHSFSQLSIG